MNSTVHIELRNVGKRFDAVEALANINLNIERGMIHALVGENGAGKSTLGKIISGVIRPDQGEVIVNGRQAYYTSPRDALAGGITMISQELTLVPKLGVLENVFLGMETHRAGILQGDDMRQRYERLTARSGFSLPTDVPVARMRVADQKKVEILRAIARNAQLIVMDEPTAALSADETEKFLDIVRWPWTCPITADTVREHLATVFAVADRSDVWCQHVADRVSDMLQQDVRRAGRREHLLASADVFRELGNLAQTMVLAELGYAKGDDSVEAMRAARYAYEDRLERVLGGLTYYDADNDGAVDDGEATAWMTFVTRR